MRRSHVTQETIAPHGPLTAIGLMSGTSLDGVDAALIRTNGDSIDEIGPGITIDYTVPERASIRALIDGDARALPAVEETLMRVHEAAITALLNHSKTGAIDCIGLHGQTILHSPLHHTSWQCANPHPLVKRFGVPVVYDFRRSDMAHGGQGAPLLPIFHHNLLQSRGIHEGMIVNIGGISNVTLSRGGSIEACDVGLGNALLNDLMEQHCGEPYDKDGQRAARGKADKARVAGHMNENFYRQPAPKSLDRHFIDALDLSGLSLEDALATVIACIVEGIAHACAHYHYHGPLWISGGGRHNSTLMESLRLHVSPQPIEPVESLQINGDFVEAYGFGMLAVRALRGLASSFPSTTGAPMPLPSGVCVFPPYEGRRENLPLDVLTGNF